jgi:hypothetical protein
MKDRSIKISGVDDKVAAAQKSTQHKAARPIKSSFDNHLNRSMKSISMKPVSMAPIAFKKTLFDPNVQLIPTYSPADASFMGSLGVVMKHEGIGFVKNDAMRGSAKMGILQSTAKNLGYKGDIKNLSQAEAVGIYKQLWDQSGASSLPYPLNTIHFDTYVNSPSAAKKILKQSGGNVDNYIAIREQRYERLASLRPDRFGRYFDGWMNRIDSLKNIAGEYARAVEAQKVKVAAAAKSGKPA